MGYLLTGGAAASVDIGGFALLSSVQMPVVPAAACSFWVATLVNFMLSSRWVFRATANRQRYVLFLIGALIGLLINVAITSVCVIFLNLPRVTAKTIAIGITFLVNFWINARFVFREDGSTVSDSAAS